MAGKKKIEQEDETFEPAFVDPYMANDIEAEETEEEDAAVSFCSKCGLEFPSYRAKDDDGGAICPECAAMALTDAQESEEPETIAPQPGELAAQAGESRHDAAPAQAESHDTGALESAEGAGNEHGHVLHADIRQYSYEDVKKNAKPKPNGHSGKIGIGKAFSGILEGLAKALLGSSIASNTDSLAGYLDNSSEYPLSLFSGEMGREYAKMQFDEQQKIAYGFAFLKKVDNSRFTLGDIISRLRTTGKFKALKTIYFSAPTHIAGEAVPPLSFDKAYAIVEKLYKENKEQ